MDPEESTQFVQDSFRGRRSDKYDVNESENAVATTNTKDPKETKSKHKIVYSVNEVPPWYLSIILGLQHYLTMFGGTVSIFYVVSAPLCVDMNPVLKAKMLGTVFFLMGIVTFLNSTFGIRLPIIQGTTASLLLPVLSLANELGSCPALSANVTLENYTAINIYPRIQLISGTIMVGSLFQVAIGLSGAVTIMVRLIGPLVIAPTITLIGLSLFSIASMKAQGQWWIALTTSLLICVFTYYLSMLKIPLPVRKKKGSCGLKKVAVFKTFPVILAIAVSWGLCAIFTATNVFPPTKGSWGYSARTDVNIKVISDTQWLQFPYPGQWGAPKVYGIGLIGLAAGFICSIVESFGDYMACARLSQAPIPPTFAVNRAVAIEGFGCFLAGALGLPVGTTSFSENVGAIAITRVASRRVVQIAACFMLLFGIVAKFGAIFVSIPDPIYGGVFITMFGMLAGVGLSNLQFVDLNSPRNLFVVGSALFMGMVVPEWAKANGAAISTGSTIFDNLCRVLLNINMFVGGVTAFILDLSLPGTREERGIDKWRELPQSMDDDPSSSNSQDKSKVLQTYDLRLSTRIFSRFSMLRYLPICPTYSKYNLDLEGQDATEEPTQDEHTHTQL